MDYIIASTSVTDEIHFACQEQGDDSREKVKVVAGGAGIYALCGIGAWSRDVLLVTGVGRDYEELYGSWYEKNQFSMEGLLVKDEKTPYTVIQYFADGEREETPRYGAGHYQKIEVTPRELAPYFSTAKGIYIFKNSSREFWKEILELKKDSKVTVMWEIANDAVCPENKETVKDIAGKLEILSINAEEAKSLLGTDSLEEIIEEFQSWGLPLIFLRRGAQGALMITPNQAVAVPSETGVSVVDPTGGGNSSSAAVLYGFTQGCDPVTCGHMGSISAALCISQYGVPAVIDESVRRQAKEALDRYAE